MVRENQTWVFYTMENQFDKQRVELWYGKAPERTKIWGDLNRKLGSLKDGVELLGVGYMLLTDYKLESHE